MKKVIALFFLFAVAGYTLRAQNIGDKAPDIKVAKWMNAEPNLKGKKLFLEFWATWCGPCKKMIPHLNELNLKYGKDLTFISMTNESPDVIAEFLKKNQMKAFVALDDKGKTNESFGVKFIPHAFLINEAGVIDWAGHPGTLTEEQIQTYIATGKISANEEQPSANEDPQNNLLYGLTVSKTNYPLESGTYSLGKHQIQYINLPIKTILEMLLNASPLKLDLKAGVISDNLDIYYKPYPNSNYEQYRTILVKDLSSALNLEIKEEKQLRTFYKITCKSEDVRKAKENEYNNLLKNTKQLESKLDDKSDKWKASIVSMDLVVRFLESTYKVIFFDETNLKGYFNFDISKSDLQSAIKDLNTSGYEVKETKDYITIYTVSAKSN